MYIEYDQGKGLVSCGGINADVKAISTNLTKILCFRDKYFVFNLDKDRK